MNFSEFKKLMGADPRNNEPETLQARESGPEFEQAAKEAEAFEAKLDAVVNFKVDSQALLGEILESTTQAPQRSRAPRWFAMAAGLVMAVGATAFVVSNIKQPDNIEDYVQVHFAHDGEALLARSDEAVDPAKVSKVMASWDLEAAPELASRVTYIKKCFTMDGLGAHMVVQTEHGNVTLLVMPKTQVQDQQQIVFDGMEAYLVSMGDYSAAVIGRSDQAVAALDSIIRDNISRTI